VSVFWNRTLKNKRLTQGFWKSELNRADKYEESWRDKAKTLNQKYSSTVDGNDSVIAYNIFFSNTETLRGAIKIDNPQPSIRRRVSKLNQENKKQQNLYNKVAEVVQKTASYFIDKNKIAEVFDIVNKDTLITGRGIAWQEYEAEVNLDEEFNPIEIKSQDFRTKYINWEDFRCSPARTLDEVSWIARRILLSKQEAKKKFPDKAKDLKYDFNYIGETDKTKTSEDNRAEVWEIWDKETKSRIFYSKNAGEILEHSKDPYKLEDFFPCEELRYIKNSISTCPAPEYYQYQQKAAELEIVCNRRTKLVESAKANGFIAGKVADKMKSLSNLGDGQFQSVDGMMGSSGGFNNLVWERDLSKLQAILAELTIYEDKLIAQIYNIIGISDILRGQGDARATATAEALKGKFGALRLVRRQEEVQLMIRNSYQKQIELICEHATLETLSMVSGVSLMTASEQQEKVNALKIQEFQANQMAMMQGQQPQPNSELQEEIEELMSNPTWEEVIQVMRSEKLRDYSLSVETNITAFDDEAAQNDAIDNLFTSMTAMISQAMPIVIQTPALLDTYKEIILSKVRVSKGGRALETSVEKAFEEIEKQAKEQAKQPEQAPQPDPNKVMEIQAKTQLEQMKMQQSGQLDSQKLQQDARNDAEQNQLTAQAQQQDIVQNQQENMLKSRDLDIKEQNNIADQQIDTMELQGEFALAEKKLMLGLSTGTNIGTEN